MAFDTSQFIPRFVADTRDHLQQLGKDILLLENQPDNTDAINAAFRAAHTIKGSARMMKQIAISDTAHKLEDLMDALRNDKLALNSPISNLIFEGIDTLTRMIDQIANGETVDEAPESLCQRLEQAANGQLPKPAAPPCAAPQQAAASIATDDNATDVVPAASAPATIVSDTLRIQARKLDQLIKLMGEIGAHHASSRHHLTQINDILKLSDDLLERIPPQSKDVIQQVRRLHSQIHKLAGDMRVDIGNRKQILNELQMCAIDMRMRPLDTIFSSFQRTVRDLAAGRGKQVQFTISGGETEMDKQIIEKLYDPLLHLIRNSIDHGMETPQARQANGKPKTGTIQVAAGYEGGKVCITLSDDGRGLDLAKLVDQAVAKGRLAREQADALSESDRIQLMFLPGLSTADIISDLSGRGVGMDVVRTNIEDDLKGSIQVRTQAGQGTTFVLQLPITMAIVHVLFTDIGGKRFAVPAGDILEIVQAAPTDVIDVMGRKAMRLRNRILPVVDLAELLLSKSNQSARAAKTLMLIAAVGENRMALKIDAVLGEDHCVIKPIPGHLPNDALATGVIIRNKNELVNVLKLSRVMTAARQMVPPVADAQDANDRPAGRILIIDDSISTREIEKNILESHGYRVSLAADGIDGFEKLAENQYDLIVSDIDMPRMDGFAFTRQAKSDERYAEIPIILVTARDTEADRRRGIQTGAEAYIVKGDFDQNNLLETIRTLIG